MSHDARAVVGSPYVPPAAEPLPVPADAARVAGPGHEAGDVPEVPGVRPPDGRGGHHTDAAHPFRLVDQHTPTRRAALATQQRRLKLRRRRA
jgi:hypothetical protein